MALIKKAMGPQAEAEDELEPNEPPEDTPEDEAEDLREGEGETAGEEAAPPQDGGQMSPQAVRAQMKLPPELQKAYDKVVLAGMKVMFSPQTHQKAMSFLQGEGEMDFKIAQGVAALIGTLIEKSNGTMPPQIVIPAGIELVAAAGDYLKQTGQEVDDNTIAGAMAEYVQIVLQQAGADSPEKMQAMLQQAGGGVPQGAPQPSAAPAPGGAQPAPGGMIGQAMKG